MLTDCPDPKEVADFHFRQLRTLSILNSNEIVKSKSVNILASSSKFGLLFVGVEQGFKVVKLEDILTLDEDKENRSIERNCPYSFVKSESPSLLAVNGSQTTLAVCVRNASGILLNLYALSAFPSTGSSWQPFCSSPLSPSFAVSLQDFSWNPTVEGLFAFCLSDGSLHIQEMTGTSLKSVASLEAANAISVCWSPKGKQLVAGKQHGSFSQYKPTLQEVKSVPPPTFEDSPVSVTSICWISTTVFAVVYVTNDSPFLCIVSTPKDSPAVYINYNDVCLGNCSPSDQKYFLHLEPLWGILICASLDSIEIAVLGDMPNWVQWDLREDGKALLPGKDGATHAMGMTVMYSAQTQIVISESEAYPPMPIIFFMTDNGLLVSFHMINTRAEAALLVSPPLTLEIKIAENNSTPDAVQRNQALLTPQSPVTSSLLPERVPAINQMSVLQNVNTIITAPNIVVKDSMFSQASQFKEATKSLETETQIMKQPESLPVCSVQEKNPASNMNTTFVVAQNEVKSSTEDSYKMAIISEIQSFTKELQDLNQLQNSALTIDSEEDMISLKTFALNLHNFQNDITQTMKSISSDIHSLKNVLLESFVNVEEACSRERRKNDHSYITMLKERALDPITARCMQRMNSHYHYLKTQLQEVSDRLDQDWINLISRKKKSFRDSHCISSTEAIYKTIVNNQKIIHSLKKKVDVLMKKVEEKKLRNTTKSWKKYHKKSTQEDLSKLADEFLQVKIASKEDGQELAVSKKLSSESQNVLKSFLKESNIVTVRPTAVYTVSQSRLLSNAVLSDDDQEKDILSKQASIQTSSTKGKSTVKAPVSQSAATPEAPSSSTITSVRKSPEKGSVSEPYTNVYEPVTPPEPVKNVQPQSITFTSGGPVVTPLTEDKKPQMQDVHPPSFSAGMTSVIMEKDSAKQVSSTSTPVPISKGLSTFVISAAATTVKPSLEYPVSKPFTVVANADSSIKKDSPSSIVSISVPELKKSESFQMRQETPMGPSFVSSSQNTSLAQIPTVTSIFSLVTPVMKHSADTVHTAFSLFQKSFNDANKSDSVEKDSGSINFTLRNQSSDSTRPTSSITDVQKQVVSSPSVDSPVLCIETATGVAKTSTLTIPFSLTQSTATTSVSDLKTSSNTSIVSKPSVVFSPVTIETVSTTGKDAQVTSASVLNVIPTTCKTLVANSASLTSLFSQSVNICSPTTPDVSAKKTESVFGMKSSLFGKETSSDAPSFFQATSTAITSATADFGKASSPTQITTADFGKVSSPAQVTTATFGKVSSPTQVTTATFGQPPSNFTSSEGGFFSQTTTFGATTTTTAAVSPNLTFSFGKPAFGQNSGSSFGLAKSFFGQNATAPVSQSGTSSSFSFGSQNSNIVFGQGSFFGSVKPSEESKNVFAASSSVKSPDASSLFRNSAASFGAAVSNGNSFTGGSFSGGGGSVAQSGFGSFQQSQSTLQQPATGFGAAPAFGSGPTFGSTPAFGTSPTFGSAASLSSVFGQQQVSSNFSSFANASSPTFGSLASQTSGFGSQMGSGFGTPAFGSTFGNQTSGFGSPSSPPSNSSAFTQWRN